MRILAKLDDVYAPPDKEHQKIGRGSFVTIVSINYSAQNATIIDEWGQINQLNLRGLTVLPYHDDDDCR